MTPRTVPGGGSRSPDTGPETGQSTLEQMPLGRMIARGLRTRNRCEVQPTTSGGELARRMVSRMRASYEIHARQRALLELKRPKTTTVAVTLPVGTAAMQRRPAHAAPPRSTTRQSRRRTSCTNSCDSDGDSPPGPGAAAAALIAAFEEWRRGSIVPCVVAGRWVADCPRCHRPTGRIVELGDEAIARCVAGCSHSEILEALSGGAA